MTLDVWPEGKVPGEPSGIGAEVDEKVAAERPHPADHERNAADDHGFSCAQGQEHWRGGVDRAWGRATTFWLMTLRARRWLSG